MHAHGELPASRATTTTFSRTTCRSIITPAFPWRGDGTAQHSTYIVCTLHLPAMPEVPTGIIIWLLKTFWFPFFCPTSLQLYRYGYNTNILVHLTTLQSNSHGPSLFPCTTLVFRKTRSGGYVTEIHQVPPAPQRVLVSNGPLRRYPVFPHSQCSINGSQRQSGR